MYNSLTIVTFQDQQMFETILRDVFAGTCDNLAVPKGDTSPTPDVSRTFKVLIVLTIHYL